MKSQPHRRRRLPIILAAGMAASIAGFGALLASDHQDTPEVELNPRMDVNDVYDLMEQQQVRRIPVTENGRIVGVIAQADVAVKEGHTDDVARVVERISEPARPQR